MRWWWWVWGRRGGGVERREIRPLTTVTWSCSLYVRAGREAVSHPADQSEAEKWGHL